MVSFSKSDLTKKFGRIRKYHSKKGLKHGHFDQYHRLVLIKADLNIVGHPVLMSPKANRFVVTAETLEFFCVQNEAD